MLDVFDNDQRIVEENTFGFGLTDVMFVRTLAAVAIVPVKAGDLVKVNHVYMMNIYKSHDCGFKGFNCSWSRACSWSFWCCRCHPPAPRDAAFTQFIASLWPEAQAAGVSRATFDRETRGLEPDYKLPDLILPGRPATGAPSQAEFVQVPADYLKEASIARLAAEGQRLMAKYRAALDGDRAALRRARAPSCSRSGAARPIMAATRCLMMAVRVLATQAYVGRRKDQYRNEFILALKIISDGEVTRKDMRSSWAGATGLTQFLPSEFYKHGVDFDGDGRATSGIRCRMRWPPPRSNSSTRAGRPGVRWAYEVRAPANVDCTMGVPEVTKPIGEWLRDGFVPVRGQKLERGRAGASRPRCCSRRASMARRS